MRRVAAPKTRPASPSDPIAWRPDVGRASLRSTRRSAKPPAMPNASPTLIWQHERLDHDPEGRVRFRRKLDHPEHQRDSDRVVRAGLSFEHRLDDAADRAVAEDGEHHGRVRRRDRRTEEAAHDPVEAERPVGEQRDESGRREGAHGPERRDGQRDGAKAPQPDRGAAVEQDHDERYCPDPSTVCVDEPAMAPRPTRSRGHQQKDRGGGSGRRSLWC